MSQRKNTQKKQTDIPDELRAPLLEAALPHVAFDGWGKKCLKLAAQDIDVEHGLARLAFVGGAVEMIDLLAHNCDAQMQDRYAGAELKIREKITQLVRLRIEAEIPHREAARRGVTFLALPQHHAASLKMLYRTVDLMWKTIGDTSTDFNFYTKRLTLGAVYSTTFLYWISDTSEDYADTWSFLDRRIENVMTFEKTKARLKKISTPDIWAYISKIRYRTT